MKLVLIPGLGYDDRIFAHLEFPGYALEYLNWIEPERRESFRNYAERMFAPVQQGEEDIVLIGHSLGGILAQEIASFSPIPKIILVSSIKSRKELPRSFRLIRPLRLDVFFTKGITLKTVKFWGKSHGFDSPEKIALFKSMVGKQSNHYLQWALRALSSWQPAPIPASTQLTQIHGTHDKTFPFKKIQQPHFRIERGSHIFPLDRAQETTDIILSAIRS